MRKWLQLSIMSDRWQQSMPSNTDFKLQLKRTPYSRKHKHKTLSIRLLSHITFQQNHFHHAATDLQAIVPADIMFIDA